MHMHEQWQLHCTGQWGRQMPLSEHVYCVAVTFKMTEWVEQWICTKLCVKGEHSPTETTGMIQKAAAKGTWWLAASSWQYTCPFIISCVEFFGKTSNCPGDSAPQQPRFGTLLLTVFPKTKITFEREEISGHWWDSGKYNGAADGRTVWGPEVPALKGTEASLSYIQCFLYFVSSSVNVSIFTPHGWMPSGQALYIQWILPGHKKNELLPFVTT